MTYTDEKQLIAPNAVTLKPSVRSLSDINAASTITYLEMSETPYLKNRDRVAP